jgi:hypothetical protein
MRYSWQGYWGRQAVGLCFALAATAFVIWVVPPSLPALRYTILALAAAAAVAIVLSAYVKADEVILQTHKTAWFWGSMGTLGLLPGLMILVTTQTVPVPVLLPMAHRTPSDWFIEGVLALLLVQCAGFLVLWAWYNLRRRG